MNFFLLSLLFVAICCSPVRVLSQAPERDDDVIRVDTDVTNLLFTAMDKESRFITTLKKEHVRIWEDGLPQTIVTFQHETDRPLSIAFLIDVSGSEQRTLPQEKAAARSFIENVLKPRDQAAVIAFTGSSFLEQFLTSDVALLHRALERVEIAVPKYRGTGVRLSWTPRKQIKVPPQSGSTAVWEAIGLTIRQLAPREVMQSQNQKRRAIILLTDGWDTSSNLNLQEAISSALLSETVIYAIGIGDEQEQGVDKASLDDLSASTGGRAFYPRQEADLKSAFVEIEKELRAQYLITYSSTNKRHDGSYRRMRVEIVDPARQKEGLVLRHRPGYFATPLP